MRLRDIIILVKGKLQVRKKRTVITIITTSVLFGVVLTLLFVANGFFKGLEKASDTHFGGPVALVNYPVPNFSDEQIQSRAIELYSESDDPDKAYPVFTPEPVLGTDGLVVYTPAAQLIRDNPFAITAISEFKTAQDSMAVAAISERVAPYSGGSVAPFNIFSPSSQTVSLTAVDAPPGAPSLFGEQFTPRLATVGGSILEPLIKTNIIKDDVIQVLFPLDYAGKMLGLARPNWFNTTNAQIREYIRTVNQRAIGLTFTGHFTAKDDTKTLVQFEVVGLLLPSDSSNNAFSNIQPDININLFQVITRSLQSSSESSSQYLGIVTNPGSTAFRESPYILSDLGIYGSKVVAAFPDTKSVVRFREAGRKTCLEVPYASACQPITTEDLAGASLEIASTRDSADIFIVAMAVIFTIVAAIIMIGIVNRVVDDERQTIALYRAVGASTKNVLQVFASYILVLCLLVIISATILGLLLAILLTFFNTGTVTANTSAMLNIPDLKSIIFIGFDPFILLVYGAVFVIGALSLLFVRSKLVSSDLVKDLKQ